MPAVNEPSADDNGVGEPSVPSLSAKHIRLRSHRQSDFPLLYDIATSPSVFWRWRFRGTIPTFEGFCQAFNQSVQCQFVVTGYDAECPLGLVVCYNADMKNRTAYLASMMAPEQFRAGTGAESMLIFLDFLFATWDFHKLYFELPSFNIEHIESAIGTLLIEEGRLREHIYYAGKRWDMMTYAIYRTSMSHDRLRRITSGLDRTRS